MNDPTDSQLLRAYAEHRSEPAFAELVRRHVAFIHSAALRMVCDSHLAEDVTQGVFVALAKNAAQLTDCAVLSGWLHRTAQNIAAQTVRTEVRRRAREQEAAAMNALLTTEPDALWANIAPHLDAALGELSEPDRDALLLRYFERKSAREMAQTLGTSEDAAQKRVSRAVERLREFFAKRGVTVGASGLVVAISANAVQAAPVGLAVTISTAAALAGTTIATTATATTIKTIAMTTLQKTLITTIVVAVGAGIYEARQAAHSREENQTLQQQQAPMAEQIQQLQRERDNATNRLASLADEIAKIKSNDLELLKLRGEFGLLRKQNRTLAQASADRTKTDQAQSLNKGFGSLGEYLSSKDTSNAGNSTPEALLKTFIYAIREGNVQLLQEMGGLLSGQSKPGDIVGKISESKAAYFKMIQTTFTNSAGFRLSSKTANDGRAYEVHLDVEPLEPLRDNPDPEFKELSVYIEQKDDGWTFGAPPLPEVATLAPALKAYAAAHDGQMPKNPSDLLPYLTTPEQQAAFQKLDQMNNPASK